MKTIDVILVSIMYVQLVIGIYFLIRTNLVFKLRMSINAKCYIWSIKHLNEPDAWSWSYDKMPSFGKMLYSFKGLKEKDWLTKEQIEKLNN